MRIGCRNCGRKKDLGAKIYCSKECKWEFISKRAIEYARKQKALG